VSATLESPLIGVLLMAVVDRFFKCVDVLIALALAGMVLLVFGNVVLRYVFNSGITTSEEVSRWLFVWMTFLGAMVALRENGHLGTDALISRLPNWGKRVCLALSQLLMIGVTAMLLQGSWAQSKINWDVEAPVTGAPMAVVYATGVVFAIFSGLILLIDFYRTITGKLGDDQLVMIKESEESVHGVPGEAK
jgi:TRAP-type transport system small permease protein